MFPSSTAAPARPTWRWLTIAPAGDVSPIVAHRLLPRDARAGPCQGREGRRARTGHARGGRYPAACPCPSDTFGVVSVAFGLRNVRDTVRGVDEMIRVARPGGKVAILEFSRPRGRFLGRLYLAFFRHVLPRIGQALAPNAGRRLRLPAPERPRVSRRPGHARPAGLARIDRAEAVSA